MQIVNENTDFCGGVTVVQPIEKGMCDLLEKQNCTYTHIMRGLKDGEPTVDTKRIDVIKRCVQPYKDFNEYLKLAENKDFRFIVSNTTESGIEFNEGDTPDKAPFVTFPAKLTLLLKRRYDLKLSGFIFLPCELIDKNGENLKKCILEYAKLWGYDEGFCAWIEMKTSSTTLWLTEL